MNRFSGTGMGGVNTPHAGRVRARCLRAMAVLQLAVVALPSGAQATEQHVASFFSTGPVVIGTANLFDADDELLGGISFVLAEQGTSSGSGGTGPLIEAAVMLTRPHRFQVVSKALPPDSVHLGDGPGYARFSMPLLGDVELLIAPNMHVGTSPVLVSYMNTFEFVDGPRYSYDIHAVLSDWDWPVELTGTAGPYTLGSERYPARVNRAESSTGTTLYGRTD